MLSWISKASHNAPSLLRLNEVKRQFWIWGLRNKTWQTPKKMSPALRIQRDAPRPKSRPPLVLTVAQKQLEKGFKNKKSLQRPRLHQRHKTKTLKSGRKFSSLMDGWWWMSFKKPSSPLDTTFPKAFEETLESGKPKKVSEWINEKGGGATHYTECFVWTLSFLFFFFVFICV